MSTLSTSQIAAYERIIATATDCLARWSPTNAMRPVMETNLRNARAALGVRA